MNNPDISNSLSISAVENARQLKQFIDLSRSIYQQDPNWIPPLDFELKQRLSEKKNPFFKHALGKKWLVYKNNQPVGRISAQIDQLNRNGVGHFGMLEARNDASVFALLLNTAESWLEKQGIVQIQGPFNLSINEESGLLVEGFDTPPYIMMGHALPYYQEHIIAAGYQKSMDLLAYLLPTDFETPAVMKRLASSAQKKVTVRTLRKKRLKEDLEILRDIFNDAWSENWQFTPFTEAEFKEIGQMIAFLVDDDLVQIAEIDGRAVSFIVAMPNINEAIADLNGKLLPFGWLKLLWRLKVKYPQTARTPLMGVRKEFHHTRLGPALAFIVIEKVRHGLRRRNVREVELSWILETNDGMRNIIDSLGGIPYKRYRVFGKELQSLS
ncbi:MAG: N-acetyltransferase [Gammaproteobacteria bacterium]